MNGMEATEPEMLEYFWHMYSDGLKVHTTMMRIGAKSDLSESR